jgi:antitoxin component YwqK of YwqJK toxin-antitoxin module
MKKYQLTLVFIIIAAVIASCSNKEAVEYYDNGNIKISYFLNNGSINGLYKLYDKDGQAKEIHIYDHNKMIGSSMSFILIKYL